MADNISVGIDGERKIFEWLEKLKAAAANNSPIWRKIGLTLQDGVLDSFDAERSPDGKAWQKSWRASLQGGKSLQNTGRLRDSIQLVVNGSDIAVGTNVIYAKTHQFGATIRAKNGKYLTFKGAGSWAKVQSVSIPARPFLGLSQVTEGKIIDLIKDYLTDAST